MRTRLTALSLTCLALGLPGQALCHAHAHEKSHESITLASERALVMDAVTGEVVYAKSADTPVPIASISKLMLALVVVGGGQAQGEALIVSEEDAQATAKSTSRLTVGTHIFRKDALHLALMASENRAAHLLARTYPGGTEAAVAAMNETARQLGMLRTHFVEPTGLSEQNISSATDLARLVARASHEPLIRADSTDTAFALPEGRREVAYHTTNKLLLRPEWDILVQKTGYIVEAGRCVALEARVAGRAVIIVLLHARSPGARLSDATRIHQWLDRAAARI